MPPLPRIALVTTSVPHIGGMERNLLQLLEFLGDRFVFSLISPEPTSSFYAELKARDLRVDVLAVNKGTKLAFRDVHRIYKMLKRSNASLVHTQDPRARYLTFPLARFLGMKAGHTFHMSPLLYRSPPLRTRLLSWLEGTYNRYLSDGLLFVSDHIRELYLRHGLLRCSNAVVINNGVDIDSFLALRAHANIFRNALYDELALSEETVIVTSVGRLHHQKGFDILINALSYLEDSQSPYHVVLIGDGDLREPLEAQARSGGLTSALTFLGWRTEEEVSRYLIASDVFVLPSRFECFPYSLLNATAAGLPCVATDVGGNAEIVLNETNGFVVSPENPTAIAKALSRLLESSSLRHRFGTAAIQSARRFTIDNMVEHTATFYTQLLNS